MKCYSIIPNIDLCNRRQKFEDAYIMWNWNLPIHHSPELHSFKYWQALQWGGGGVFEMLEKLLLVWSSWVVLQAL